MTKLIVAFFAISANAPKQKAWFGLKKRDIYICPTSHGALLPNIP